MSALAYLSGISQGVGEEYAKQAEDKRQFQQQKDLLTASAHQKAMEDPNLDFPTWAAHAQAYYKTMGVPDKDAQTLISHHKGIFDQQQAKDAQKPQVSGAPGGQPAFPTVPGNGQSSPDQAATALPGSGLSTPGLPPLPQYQQTPVNQGEISATTQANQQNILTEAQIQKQREMLQLYKEQQGTGGGGHFKITMGPNGVTAGPDAGSAIPGLSEGSKWLQDFPNAKTPNGEAPHPGAFYRGRRFEQDGAVELTPAQEVTNAHIVRDPNSETGASFVYSDPNGNEVSRRTGAPSEFLPKEHDGLTDHWVLDPVSGQWTNKPVRSKSITAPVIRGQASSPQTPGAPLTLTSPIPQLKAPVTKPAIISPGGIAQSPAGPGKIGIPGGPAGILPNPGNGNPGAPAPSVDPSIRYWTGQVASGRAKLSDLKGDGQSLTDKQFRGAVQRNLAALGLDLNKVNGAQFEAARFSQKLEEKMPHILAEVEDLDKKGKLGVVASRFNEFMAGTVGAGDPEFTKLREDIGLVQTALMKIHTGSRGSTTIMNKFGHLINGGTMDAQTLKTSLEGADYWIRSYADLVPTGEETLGTGRGGATPATGVPSNRPPLSDILK